MFDAVHLMESNEPPTYRQEMKDRWTAWEDEFLRCLLQEVGYAGFNEALPKMELWSFFSRGDAPEAVAMTWANLYRAKRNWTVPWMASDKEESGGTRP